MEMRAKRSWLLGGCFALGAGVVLALSACNSPFIPIPPPGDPTFTPVVSTDAMGGTHNAWETRGQSQPALSGARIYVFNSKIGVGVIARAAADGSYVASPMDGQPGDPIEIFYETPEGERSSGICRVLQSGLSREPCP